MASQVDICNLALIHLGVKSILSIDEASTQAQKLKALWPTSLDSVLRDHPWNFATRTDSLAQISGETLLNWNYVYQYPSNCVFLRKVLNSSTVEGHPEDFKEVLSSLNTKAIAANIQPAYAEYTARVTDTSLFDAHFVKLLSYHLGATAAQSLTGKLDLAEKLMGIYGSVLGRAQQMNKNEGTEKAPKRSSYVEAR
jgi:hypothetical protein